MTPAQAAARLGCTEQWVRSLCKQGRIKATKLGRDWQIAETDLPRSLAAIPGPPMGRPPKKVPDANTS